MMVMWRHLLLLAAFQLLFHVVSTVDIASLRPEEIAIMQFDSRPLKNYWLAAANWNSAYCKRHGHQFIYYSNEQDCHYKEEPLASAWCKVKAMINAQDDHPAVQLFLYLDSDAVIDKKFAHMPLGEMLGIMQSRLSWEPERKPVVFNQDGPCWWCSFIADKTPYTTCLNAGTVVWYRHPLSSEVLWRWWNSTMDPYEADPIRRRFRLKWPWEQDRQMAIYHRHSAVIQVASQPSQPFQSKRAGHTHGWCLSHLPESGCFVSHYCHNANSKQVMRRLYQVQVQAQGEGAAADADVLGGGTGTGTAAVAGEGVQEEGHDFKVSFLHFDPF